MLGEHSSGERLAIGTKALAQTFSTVSFSTEEEQGEQARAVLETRLPGSVLVSPRPALSGGLGVKLGDALLCRAPPAPSHGDGGSRWHLRVPLQRAQELVRLRWKTAPADCIAEQSDG